ncbi:MAG: hypothetical protein Q8761_03365, partial [Sweet potato little leaf phytoplasma]|nr:hypothetical protein [Sweet potato little leaf phytoplasma]
TKRGWGRNSSIISLRPLCLANCKPNEAKNMSHTTLAKLHLHKNKNKILKTTQKHGEEVR